MNATTFVVRRCFPAFVASLLLLSATGCNTHSFYDMVQTPRIYTQGIEPDPFDGVPAVNRTPYTEVIYVTDRVPTTVSRRGQEYGYARSRSAAYGTMRVWMGPKTWEGLVKESRQEKRSPDMVATGSDINEFGRFPETPEPIDKTDGQWVYRPEVIAKRTAEEEMFRNLVRRKLGESDIKDVYLLIHGYSCEFEWPAYVLAQIWHFMGRTGVPIAYSWPASSPGLLRGYQYDRESGEFTVTHLKRTLQLLGSIKEVHKVHIHSHSRGTDVATSALRELCIEYGSAEKAGAALKLGTFILAAADLDPEVASQRVVEPQVPLAADQFVIYVSEADRALGLSSWLFGKEERLGSFRSKDLRKEGTQFLMKYSDIEVIDARVTTPKIFSHSYFFAHPGGLSDLIRVYRDHAPPGAENGRPLKRDPSGFWIMDEDYQNEARK